MAENRKENGEWAVNWGEVGREYIELMDDVMPYLSPAEQITYQRLFRLSHVRGYPFSPPAAIATWRRSVASR